MQVPTNAGRYSRIPTVRWRSGRGIFLKIFNFVVYFCNFDFFKYKNEKSSLATSNAQAACTACADQAGGTWASSSSNRRAAQGEHWAAACNSSPLPHTCQHARLAPTALFFLTHGTRQTETTRANACSHARSLPISGQTHS